MKIDLPFIPIAAIVSLIIFAYMRNRQGRRNDARREKLEQKQEELLELLKRNNSPTENITDNDN